MSSRFPPRCHLPTMPVAYPLAFSSLASTTSLSRRRVGGFQGIPTRGGKRPVRSPAREGEEIGAGTRACERAPSEAKPIEVRVRSSCCRSCRGRPNPGGPRIRTRSARPRLGREALGPNKPRRRPSSRRTTGRNSCPPAAGEREAAQWRHRSARWIGGFWSSRRRASAVRSLGRRRPRSRPPPGAGCRPRTETPAPFAQRIQFPSPRFRLRRHAPRAAARQRAGAGLRARLARARRAQGAAREHGRRAHDIPLVIGGREIRTGDTAQAVMPHDHATCSPTGTRRRPRTWRRRSPPRPPRTASGRAGAGRTAPPCS